MRMYFNEEEVKFAALKFFEGDSLAASVWTTKYALKEGDYFLEKSPKDSIRRYIKEFYRIEQTYPNSLSEKRITELLDDYKYFIPAGSPMFGIGNTTEKISLGNCFVVGDFDDSFGGIFAADESLEQIMKRRGGVGLDLSYLRPKGASVNNAAKNSSGAVSFMDKFSHTTRLVAQEGRRGALMLTIGIDHPDSEDFILSKDDLTKITGANISLRVTDEFMKAVQNDTNFELKFKNFTKHVKARKLWELIIHQAWKSAEPGLLFWDTIIRESPADCYSEEGFKTVSTNPCGELPLSPYDSCRLSSMNVYSYVKNPFELESNFDFQKLYEDSFDSQKLMDDLIDLEEEKINSILVKISNNPEKDSDKEYRLWVKILKTLKEGRRTGLGQTGLADAGAALGLIYGSKDFIDFAEAVQETIAKASYASSVAMAKERGAFPVFKLDKEKENPFIERIFKDAPKELLADYHEYGRRNIANLTIAPNGSISLLPKVTSGIEPVFLKEFFRRRKVNKNTKNSERDENGDYWETYSVLHPKYQKCIEITGNINTPYDNATSDKINYLDKVRLQGVVQKWVDHSISVTHNLPKETSEELVGNLYMEAWESGCKGITVYREGSREGVLIAKELERKESLLSKDAPKRPRVLQGEAFATTVKGEKFTVIVGLLDGNPYEVFAYKGNGLSGKGEVIKIKKGNYKFVTPDKEEIITDDLSEEQEAITRGYSFGLRHGGHVKFAAEQLNKTKGDLSSFNKAIARVLRKFISEDTPSSEKCPECNYRLVYQSGCLQCLNCGHSKCN
jgi:ribonucleoside-diphosphate reductase alpha chain